MFNACTFLLVALAKLTGLSYQQVSVVVNIYLQGAVLALSAWLPSVAVVMAQNLHLQYQRLHRSKIVGQMYLQHALLYILFLPFCY